MIGFLNLNSILFILSYLIIIFRILVFFQMIDRMDPGGKGHKEGLGGEEKVEI